MIDRFRDVARALVAVLLLGVAGAAAQTAKSPTSQKPGAVSQAGSPTAQAPAQPAGPAGPQINIAEITARANRDVASTSRRQSTDGSTNLTAWRVLSKSHACAIRS